MSSEISEKTKARYKAVTKLLLSQAINEGCTKERDFYHWLEARWKSGYYMGATWRQYKSALNYTMEYSEGLERINRLTGRVKKSRTRKVRKKIKSVGEKNWQSFEKLLEHTHKKTARQIKCFMEAGIHTGLRPSEWGDAVLYKNETGEWELKVKNAKHTQGRSFAEHRYLIIESEEAVQKIQEHQAEIIKWLAEHPEKKYSDYQEKIRMNIARARQKIPKTYQKNSPTLYSARHQFKNNAIKAKVSEVDLAYMMGHGSVETARMEYGRKKSRSTGFYVRPGREIPKKILDSKKYFDKKHAISKTNIPEFKL